MTEHLDVIIVGVYLVSCLVIGIQSMGKVSNIRDYALGRGTFSTGVIAATLFASHIGASSTVGAIQEVASFGLIFGVALFVQPLMWLLTSWIFADRIQEFRDAGCISFSDIMERLYGKSARFITDICTLLVAVTVVNGQIIAIGYLFQTFLGVSIFNGALIGFGAVVIYSFAGGVRAVVITDIFQALVLFVALPIVCFLGYYDVGGLRGIMEVVPHSHFEINFSEPSILALVSVFVWMVVSINPVFVQRFLMAKDKEQVQSALHGLFIGYFPLGLLLFVMGFVVKAKVMTTNEGTGVYQMIEEYVPSGFKGVVVAGLMSAAMSTADSWLNTASIICAHFFKQVRVAVSPKQELFAARVSLMILSVFAVVTTFYGSKNLVHIDMVAGNFWEPITYMPVAMGFLGVATSGAVFWLSALFGVVGTLWGAHFTARILQYADLFDFSGVSEIIGILFSMVAMLVAHGIYVKYVLKRKLWHGRLKEHLLDFYYSSIHDNFSWKALVRAFQYHEQDRWRYYCLGIFGITYFMLSSFAFADFGDMSKATMIGLRIGALFLCFLLCIHEIYLPQKFQEYLMPWLWNFSVIYCLPFLSIYTSMVTDYDVLWLINVMISIAMFYILSTGRVTIWGTFIGFVAARVVFAITDYKVVTEVGNYGMILLIVYIISIMAMIYMLHEHRVHQDRENLAKLLYGQAMAHELVQPLAGAYVVAESMIRAYENGEATSPEDIERLRQWAILTLMSCKKGMRSVKMMLSALRGDIRSASDNGSYSVAECVQEAIDEYGFNEHDVKRIEVLNAQSEDFDFYGSKYFLKQVINNLIHNALKYAGHAATIKIWWKHHVLYVEDNGVGIPKRILPQLFKRFQNIEGSLSGSGIGLAFVKRVMEAFGGDVECDSVETQYTKFKLSFPASFARRGPEGMELLEGEHITD